MTLNMHLLLMLVQPDDAAGLLDELTRQQCATVRFPGRGGLQRPATVALAALATPAQIPLALAAALRTCARRCVETVPSQAIVPAMLLDPLAGEAGGATIFALPVRNGVRWSLDRTPQSVRPCLLPGISQHHEDRRATGMDLLVAIIPDAAADRALEGLSSADIVATAIGSTGGLRQRGSTTLLIGLPCGRARTTAALLQRACAAVAGTGTAFALNTAWHLRF